MKISAKCECVAKLGVALAMPVLREISEGTGKASGTQWLAQ
jgi:hypothetical protein